MAEEHPTKEDRAASAGRAVRGDEPPEDTVQPEGSGSSEGAKMAPEGVGESKGSRGEDMVKGSKEAGRYDEGTKGDTDRPAGSSDERDTTGI